MATIEYTKSKNEFLLTGYTSGHSDITKLYFFPRADGTLYIGNESFKVSKGMAIIRSLDIKNGTHTPVLEICGTSYVCDRIKSEAGTVIPERDENERIFYLTKKSVSAEERIALLEERLSELSNAVYGTSIF